MVWRKTRQLSFAGLASPIFMRISEHREKGDGNAKTGIKNNFIRRKSFFYAGLRWLKSSCTRLEMGTHLPNELWCGELTQRPCCHHKLCISLSWSQYSIQHDQLAELKGQLHLAQPNAIPADLSLGINLLNCMLPGWLLAVFLVCSLYLFYILVRPCCGTLSIPPPSDKTSSSTWWNTPDLHLLSFLFFSLANFPVILLVLRWKPGYFCKSSVDLAF